MRYDDGCQDLPPVVSVSIRPTAATRDAMEGRCHQPHIPPSIPQTCAPYPTCQITQHVQSTQKFTLINFQEKTIISLMGLKTDSPCNAALCGDEKVVGTCRESYPFLQGCPRLIILEHSISVADKTFFLPKMVNS